MIAYFDDTTAPNPIGRKRPYCCPLLTAYRLAVTLAMPYKKSKAGRGNLFFRLGVKTPRFFAAFLCPSFRQAASRAYSVMAGCFGRRSTPAAPSRGISTPLQPVAHAVESMTGGYSLSRLGATV